MDDCPNQIECCDAKLFDYSLEAYPVYTNDELTFFIPCPDGFVCEFPGTTVTIPAGTIHYRPTTSEGNSSSSVQQAISTIAQSQAQSEGYRNLQPKKRLFSNSAQTVSCSDGATGDFASAPFFTGPGQVTIPPGVYTSNTSQEEADSDARDFAQGLINDYANCHWVNTEQSCTATCPDGKFGDPVTKTTPAGTVTSTESQAAADAEAKDFACVEAEGDLVCYDFANTEQTVTCPMGTTGPDVIVPAGMFFSNVSQADADNQAIAYGESVIVCTSTCGQTAVNALTWVHTGGGSGSGSGGSASVSTPGAQSKVTASFTNTCPDPVTLHFHVAYDLQTKAVGMTGGFCNANITLSGTDWWNQGFNTLLTTCQQLNGDEDAPDKVVAPGATVQILFQVVDQTAACGANAQLTITAT